MNKIISIAVFTSIRSEYGVLVPILKKLKSDVTFDLRLLVGGAHLLKEHGYTIEEIEKDGFSITFKLPFLCTDNESNVNTRSMSLLQMQIGDYLAKNSPDLLMVVGDRFELLPVVSAALVLNIPVAHISGGDITEGAIDNQVRHAVSKMSHLHFTGTEKSRSNLIKMGEEEWRVVYTGEPGIDSILSIDFIEKEELFNQLGLNMNSKLVIVTFHPETIHNTITPYFLNDLFEQMLSKYKDYQFLVTSSNFDSGGLEINETFIKLAEIHNNLFFVKSLGQKRYYSILKYAVCMLGNSSSGIIEAQSFKLPVINIGNRQQGRERNVNMIEVDSDTNLIINAMNSITEADFILKVQNSENIYGSGNCANIIHQFLTKIDRENLLLKKNTYN